MTISVAAPLRLTAGPRVNIGTVYAAALVAWLVTRVLVLVHQGAWPWMNAFVVAAARGMTVGDWNEAVRPQLPAVVAVPLVLLGADERTAVASLYILGSLIQLGAFLLLVRALFPDRMLEQALALALFVLAPFNHSIHHYRDVPVLLASSAVFLIAAHWLRHAPSAPLTLRASVALVGAMVLGVWSRTEVVTFVGVLVLAGIVVWRRRVLPLAALYVAAVVIGLGVYVIASAIQGVDRQQLARYQVHTFLDSTPESWLTPECRAAPTENCRERDGMTYFGPVVMEAGVLPLVLNHPLTTVAKTARSAIDNAWIILGPNISTFPGIVPFLLVALAGLPAARIGVRAVKPAAWMVALATLGQTLLPPLSWAPPHPQYHLQLIVAIVIVVVPILAALLSVRRGPLIVGGFFAANAALSAFRYTRYPGY